MKDGINLINKLIKSQLLNVFETFTEKLNEEQGTAETSSILEASEVC